MSTHSPYEVLEVPKNATIKDIKKQYKNLVRESTPEHDPERFMEIRAAYDMLMSTEMNAQEFFPIYKKPLEFLTQFGAEKSTDAATVNKTLLSAFFETPFDTEKELKTLFNKK